jgi:tetratricopeptide (TPR) repeat protein
MRLRDLSLEQLEELEQELHDQEEPNDGYYAELVNLYKEMHRRLNPLAKKDPNQYGFSMQYTQKLLVSYLIKYGTYLKMTKIKDDDLAIKSLKEAIDFDPINPMAHYRLGFLSYKNKDFSSAVQYFESAIDFHPTYKNTDYTLNEKQLVHAYMYLTNSALHVAGKTYKKMEKLERGQSEQLPNYELSPIYKLLSHNDDYLLANAFYKITNQNICTCSKQDCEDTIENYPHNTVVLYFNDRENIIMFNGREVKVSQKQAETLRHMLLLCSKDQPGTRMTFRDFFSSFGEDGEVKIKTFRKSMERLNEKLGTIGLEDAIKGARYREEPAYSFEENIPYMVLYRVDDLAGNEYVSR